MDRNINFILVWPLVSDHDILNSKLRSNFRHIIAFKVLVCFSMVGNRRSDIWIDNGIDNRSLWVKKSLYSKYSNVSFCNYNFDISNYVWWVWYSKLYHMFYLGVLRWHNKYPLYVNAGVWVWKFCWPLWYFYIGSRYRCICILNFVSKINWF